MNMTENKLIMNQSEKAVKLYVGKLYFTLPYHCVAINMM